MTQSEIIGRVLLQANPEMAREYAVKFRRTLNDPKYVQAIYDQVQSDLASESAEDRKDVFVATVYQLYQPLSFLRCKDKDKEGKALGKLPVGVRDEMQRCIGANNPETVNAIKSFVEAPMKPESNGVVRPFKEKVMNVVEKFKCFSIHADDSQFKLFA